MVHLATPVSDQVSPSFCQILSLPKLNCQWCLCKKKFTGLDVYFFRCFLDHDLEVSICFFCIKNSRPNFRMQKNMGCFCVPKLYAVTAATEKRTLESFTGNWTQVQSCQIWNMKMTGSLFSFSISTLTRKPFRCIWIHVTICCYTKYGAQNDMFYILLKCVVWYHINFPKNPGQWFLLGARFQDPKGFIFHFHDCWRTSKSQL